MKPLVIGVGSISHEITSLSLLGHPMSKPFQEGTYFLWSKFLWSDGIFLEFFRILVNFGFVRILMDTW